VIERIVILTLVRGGVYAVLASGMTFIFGVGGMLNLAYTAFVMLTGYGMYYFTKELGWGNIPSIGVSVVGVVLLSVLIYRFFIDKVRQHGEVILLMTVGFAMIFQEAILVIFGSYYRSTTYLVPGATKILGVSVPNQYLLILGVTVALFVILRLVLTKTKVGIALGATASDAEVATLVGINVARTMQLSMGIAACMAAVAGVLVSSIWTISPFMWVDPLGTILVIIILGGLGSIKGSLIGAFIVALVEVATQLMVPAGVYLSTPFVMIILIIVLVVRPGGLFGLVFEEERL
jgi:branched-chain amino acid transport system permease protein